jgi:hypothetical protein
MVNYNFLKSWNHTFHTYSLGELFNRYFLYHEINDDHIINQALHHEMNVCE